MAFTLPSTGTQGPMLFEDLAVYFSQEECVSLHPAPRSLSRDAAQDSLEDMALLGGESESEVNQQLNLESMELEALALEKYSIAVPLVHYPEKSSDDEVRSPEGTISDGTSICQKRLISLLVTIDNHTPLIELSQCLGTRALSEILEFPWEESENVYKCPECDQSFSDNSCLISHKKIHSGEKKYECGYCGKTFNHRTNLRTHRRIHTGEKPYTCAECGTSFRQHSHLSRHMKIHITEKPYSCGICGRGFMWLPGLAQHQKTHAPDKARVGPKRRKEFGQKTNLALPKKMHTLATQDQYLQGRKNLEQPPRLALPKKGLKEKKEEEEEEGSKQVNNCGENLHSFSKFKPLKCAKCEMTFLRISELISHENVHTGEKPYECETRVKSFILDSDLTCHQKKGTQERNHLNVPCVGKISS
ncbi:zinc finger protein 597 [Dasypus novemcinctus]|uniref:zinc finger protein 597 n=1 Tax=Dasypus novemcinctus TaxID=9361 RepID=UPI00032896D0|nr:zinc finger protein 597 [Dasypus novemcinctus]XP_004474404.1 zinc finger protein 597 [Dasypus novemcinctus]XP_004474405.1 zinc finger protein 597 [Dasypus novemcinctus]